MLKQKLSTHHPLISTAIQEFISQNKELFSNHHWADDVFTKLSEYSTGGKMMRGGLVIESYLEFSKEETSQKNSTDKNKNIPTNVLQIAAAIELFSSGLLIHDDIIDKDEMRRGKPAIHTQFGTNMGIFIGNIEYFLSYSLITESELDDDVKNKLLSLFSKELIGVSLAQLNDISLSFEDNNEFQSTTNQTLNKILEIYQLKTARYSLVLPMLAGAILAKQNKNILDLIEKFAENIGIIFQIKDDELDIFGNTKKTGKPVGGDIREGKKTIFWFYAMKMADEDTKKRLESVFGNKDITQSDIEFIKTHLQESGAMKEINKIVNNFAEKSKIAIKNNENPLFSQIISYNLNRNQ